MRTMLIIIAVALLLSACTAAKSQYSNEIRLYRGGHLGEVYPQA